MFVTLYKFFELFAGQQKRKKENVFVKHFNSNQESSFRH